MADHPIKQMDPGAGYHAHQAEIDAAVLRVLSSGWYILGSEVEAFEREFAAYLGVEHAIGVASGTDAVTLALRACGIGPGDEVLTVSHSAVASVTAIEQAGATPVFVDIDPLTYTLSPESLAEVLAARSGTSPPPKALLVVHLYGHCADMPAIMALARRHGLKVIEDCAQSHGAHLNGIKAGAWGEAAAFSFYPTKNLGALGDGGAVVTKDVRVAETVRLLRQYGWRERFVSSVPGMNSRLDELQAAILRVRMPFLDAENGQRRALARIYHEGLAAASVTLPIYSDESVFHQYVIRSHERDRLAAKLRQEGIATAIHYPVPIHLQPAYSQRIRSVIPLLETEKAAQEILSLPMYPQLRESEAGRVVEVILRAD